MALASASPAALALAAGLLAAPPTLSAEFGPSPRGHGDSDGPSPAPSEPSDEDRENAKLAFDEGLAAVASGEFDDAVTAFERAYGLRPHPVTLFNLALALEKAERLPEAWEIFDDVIDIVESNAERREIRRHMRNIEGEIAIVEVDASPEQRLCIDGLAMPVGTTTDYRLAVEPGRHELTLDRQNITAEFEAGDRRVLLLDDANELIGGRRQGVLMPAMVGTTIGTGTLAFALGVGAAASQDPRTRTGLAAGAATSAGLAVAAGVVALLLETRTMPDPSSRSRAEPGEECPGSPELEQRLDLRLGPTLDRPAEFVVAPPTPGPREPGSTMPVPVPRMAAFPHPHGIQPPRGEL
jgi:hypothetical protein